MHVTCCIASLWDQIFACIARCTIINRATCDQHTRICLENEYVIIQIQSPGSTYIDPTVARVLTTLVRGGQPSISPLSLLFDHHKLTGEYKNVVLDAFRLKLCSAPGSHECLYLNTDTTVFMHEQPIMWIFPT